MKIGECELMEAVTCRATEKVQVAAGMLREKRLRHLYVVDDDNTLLGVFAALDVVYKVLAEGKDYRELTVEAVMNKDVTSFDKEDRLPKMLGFMTATNVMTCPVTDNGKLCGVLGYRQIVDKLLAAKK